MILLKGTYRCNIRIGMRFSAENGKPLTYYFFEKHFLFGKQ